MTGWNTCLSPASLGFMSVHFGHRPALEPYKVVNARRFTDQSAIKLRKSGFPSTAKPPSRCWSRPLCCCLGDGEPPLHRGVPYASALDYEHLDQLADGMLRRFVRMADEALPHLKAGGPAASRVWRTCRRFGGDPKVSDCFPVDSKGTLPRYGFGSF